MQIFNLISGENSQIGWIELELLLTRSMNDGNISNKHIIFYYSHYALNFFIVNHNGFSKEIYHALINMVDINHTGLLNFNEFRVLFKDILNWKDVFKKYDNENSGKLYPFQLYSALSSAGFHLNNKIINSLAHRYGTENGSIHFDDFIMCAVKLKTMLIKNCNCFL